MLDWSRHERVFEVNTDSTGKDVLEVFENRTINRESLGHLKVVVTGWLLTIF